MRDWEWNWEWDRDWEWGWTNWLGFVVSRLPRTEIQFHAAWHKDKGRQQERQTLHSFPSYQLAVYQLPVPCSQSLIPIPQWAQLGHQRRQVDIQKCAHFAQKNFKLASFIICCARSNFVSYVVWKFQPPRCYGLVQWSVNEWLSQAKCFKFIEV